MFFNSKEEKIISKFYKNLNIADKKLVRLVWKDSYVTARFDSCFEDLDDDEEEICSFIFETVDIVGEPPIKVSEYNLFLINYKNFPEQIICDEKIIG